MISVDRYLSKRWTPEYDCRAFAREVWRDATGEEIRLDVSERRRFTRLASPVSPCLVLMRGPGAHVGVYWRGRVLHLVESGAEWTQIEQAARGYRDVRYYA